MACNLCVLLFSEHLRAAFSFVNNRGRIYSLVNGGLSEQTFLLRWHFKKIMEERLEFVPFGSDFRLLPVTCAAFSLAG